MAKYFIDFEGWTMVDAKSKEEAEQVFWENYIMPAGSTKIVCIEEGHAKED